MVARNLARFGQQPHWPRLVGENASFWHYFTHCIMESDHHSQRVKMLASLVRVRYNIKKLHLNHVVWFLFTK